MLDSPMRLKMVPLAIAVFVGSLSATSFATPITYPAGGNITLDAAYSLGSTALVPDGLGAGNVYANASGADFYLSTSDNAGNSIFFHTYGFSGEPTYFGARASGQGNFFGTTSASYSNLFTNTSAVAQMFTFSFYVSDGQLGLTGAGSGFADLLLRVQKDGTDVARDHTTINQTATSADATCNTDDFGSSTLRDYMGCNTLNQTFANGGGGQPFSVSLGVIDAGASFTLNYDIIATVSGDLSQSSGGGGYGCYGGENTFARAVGEGGGCNFPGTAIARSGDPFGGSFFDINGQIVSDNQVAGLAGRFSNVPEPGSIALMGVALAGLAAARRKKQDTKG